MEKSNHIIRALVANSVIVLSTVILNVLDLLNFSKASVLDFKGLERFRTFTIDSNVFAAVISLIFIIVGLVCLIKKQNLPYWITSLRYVSTSLLALVLFTVAFFLSPYYMTYGHTYFELFEGNNTFFHLLNPLISLYSLWFLENQYAISKKERIYPLFLTLSYGVLYFLMVVIFDKWPDFYGMTFGGKLYLGLISLTSILLVTYLLSSLIRLINNKLIKTYRGN